MKFTFPSDVTGAPVYVAAFEEVVEDEEEDEDEVAEGEEVVVRKVLDEVCSVLV